MLAETDESVREWFTGPTSNRKSHTITPTRITTVNSTVNDDARTRNQVTGFNLAGFGRTQVSGTVPVVGETCTGVGTEGTWISVDLVNSTGGLYVSGNLLPQSP